MKNWYENDIFWTEMQRKLFSNDMWEQAGRDLDLILELLHPEKDAVICDLCCGPGRHTLELAERGFRVTGVDRTVHYINALKKEASRENLTVECVQADMREFIALDTFDIILNLYTSFGYFENQADDMKVLKNIFTSLKKGGRFIIEMMGKEVLARIFAERDWYDDDGVLFLVERKVKQDWSWIESRWIMIDDNDRKEFTVSHRLYSGKELADILKTSGFSKVTLYGSFAGIPYNQNARRLVAVAVKN